MLANNLGAYARGGALSGGVRGRRIKVGGKFPSYSHADTQKPAEEGGILVEVTPRGNSKRRRILKGNQKLPRSKTSKESV